MIFFFVLRISSVTLMFFGQMSGAFVVAFAAKDAIEFFLINLKIGLDFEFFDYTVFFFACDFGDYMEKLFKSRLDDSGFEELVDLENAC